MQGMFEYTVFFFFLIRKNTNRILFPGNERIKSKDIKLLLRICFTVVLRVHLTMP